jgi:hypothetical protein
VRFGHVTDTDGHSYSTKIALPAETHASEVTVRSTEQKGSEQHNVRRREILRPLKDKLVEYLKRHGGTIAANNVQRVLGDEFFVAVKEANLNKRLLTKGFVELFPDEVTFNATAKGGGSTVTLVARSGSSSSTSPA